MASEFHRRKFIGSTVAAGMFTIVPRHVLGGAGYVSPSDKITLAHIGMGTQGFREIPGLLAQPAIQIVAVCDPNRDSNDYLEWGKGGIRNQIQRLIGDPTWRQGAKGCPGGREVGREVVDAYYARERKADSFAACAAYSDYRELLDQEKDLDAVKVMTPDHLHAIISIAAMRKGKHVVMHKPVANRLIEGRKVLDAARESQVATHLLAYGSGTGNGLIARQVRQGVIGRLREIHNWTNRPVWPQYAQIPTDKPPLPQGLDWDLWLGPAAYRPFHPNYTHTVFRGWYDFGGGSMADMGIYSLWPVFEALELDAASTAQARATHACTAVDNVCQTIRNDFSYPTACTLQFEFAARGDRPALKLFWYDGGMQPRVPEEIEVLGTELSREGILFIGDEGTILAGFHGQDPQLFAKGEQKPLREVGPGEASRAGGSRSGGRHNPWLDEIRGGEQSPGSFLSAAAITDTVNLGTVALRAGKKVEFDSEKVKISNLPSANKYLTRQYRSGWEV